MRNQTSKKEHLLGLIKRTKSLSKDYMPRKRALNFDQCHLEFNYGLCTKLPRIITVLNFLSS